MPWDQNFKYELHCGRTFRHLKLKTFQNSINNIHALYKQLHAAPDTVSQAHRQKKEING